MPSKHKQLKKINYSEWLLRLSFIMSLFSSADAAREGGSKDSKVTKKEKKSQTPDKESNQNNAQPQSIPVQKTPHNEALKNQKTAPQSLTSVLATEKNDVLLINLKEEDTGLQAPELQVPEKKTTPQKFLSHELNQSSALQKQESNILATEKNDVLLINLKEEDTGLQAPELQVPEKKTTPQKFLSHELNQSSALQKQECNISAEETSENYVSPFPSEPPLSQEQIDQLSKDFENMQTTFLSLIAEGMLPKPRRVILNFYLYEIYANIFGKNLPTLELFQKITVHPELKDIHNSITDLIIKSFGHMKDTLLRSSAIKMRCLFSPYGNHQKLCSFRNWHRLPLKAACTALQHLQDGTTDSLVRGKMTSFVPQYWTQIVSGCTSVCFPKQTEFEILYAFKNNFFKKPTYNAEEEEIYKTFFEKTKSTKERGDDLIDQTESSQVENSQSENELSLSDGLKKVKEQKQYIVPFPLENTLSSEEITRLTEEFNRMKATVENLILKGIRLNILSAVFIFYLFEMHQNVWGNLSPIEVLKKVAVHPELKDLHNSIANLINRSFSRTSVGREVKIACLFTPYNTTQLFRVLPSILEKSCEVIRFFADNPSKNTNNRIKFQDPSQNWKSIVYNQYQLKGLPPLTLGFFKNKNFEEPNYEEMSKEHYDAIFDSNAQFRVPFPKEAKLSEEQIEQLSTDCKSIEKTIKNIKLRGMSLPLRISLFRIYLSEMYAKTFGTDLSEIELLKKIAVHSELKSVHDLVIGLMILNFFDVGKQRPKYTLLECITALYCLFTPYGDSSPLIECRQTKRQHAFSLKQGCKMIEYFEYLQKKENKIIEEIGESTESTRTDCWRRMVYGYKLSESCDDSGVRVLKKLHAFTNNRFEEPIENHHNSVVGVLRKLHAFTNNRFQEPNYNDMTKEDYYKIFGQKKPVQEIDDLNEKPEVISQKIDQKNRQIVERQDQTITDSSLQMSIMKEQKKYTVPFPAEEKLSSEKILMLREDFNRIKETFKRLKLRGMHSNILCSVLHSYLCEMYEKVWENVSQRTMPNIELFKKVLVNPKLKDLDNLPNIELFKKVLVHPELKNLHNSIAELLNCFNRKEGGNQAAKMACLFAPYNTTQLFRIQPSILEKACEVISYFENTERNIVMSEVIKPLWKRAITNLHNSTIGKENSRILESFKNKNFEEPNYEEMTDEDYEAIFDQKKTVQKIDDLNEKPKVIPQKLDQENRQIFEIQDQPINDSSLQMSIVKEQKKYTVPFPAEEALSSKKIEMLTESFNRIKTTFERFILKGMHIKVRLKILRFYLFEMYEKIWENLSEIELFKKVLVHPELKDLHNSIAILLNESFTHMEGGEKLRKLVFLFTPYNTTQLFRVQPSVLEKACRIISLFDTISSENKSDSISKWHREWQETIFHRYQPIIDKVLFRALEFFKNKNFEEPNYKNMTKKSYKAIFDRDLESAAYTPPFPLESPISEEQIEELKADCRIMEKTFENLRLKGMQIRFRISLLRTYLSEMYEKIFGTDLSEIDLLKKIAVHSELKSVHDLIIDLIRKNYFDVTPNSGIHYISNNITALYCLLTPYGDSAPLMPHIKKRYKGNALSLKKGCKMIQYFEDLQKKENKTTKEISEKITAEIETNEMKKVWIRMVYGYKPSALNQQSCSQDTGNLLYFLENLHAFKNNHFKEPNYNKMSEKIYKALFCKKKPVQKIDDLNEKPKVSLQKIDQENRQIVETQDQPINGSSLQSKSNDFKESKIDLETEKSSFLKRLEQFIMSSSGMTQQDHHQIAETANQQRQPQSVKLLENQSAKKSPQALEQPSNQKETFRIKLYPTGQKRLHPAKSAEGNFKSQDQKNNKTIILPSNFVSTKEEFHNL
jgi:hypothetical protein